ncbi:MAG: hypothetical protein LBG28_10770 [Tannerella sp.]|jgi:hypothetical protein|nr:hypothetical protein [Tannerella sp.]
MRHIVIILFFLGIFMTGNMPAQEKRNIPALDNPMSVRYLRKNLRKSHPRLVLNPSIENNLKKKLKTDPVVKNVYEAIRLNAREIMDKPFLERIKEGRRLLAVSREMLYRVNMLGMVYRIEKDPGWVSGTNNWNQVCNGGMIAASIAIAEKDPDLAAKTIKRALDGIPHALSSYLPDGVYPEGSTYWDYGTGFSVITAAILESAFGTDFGHTRHEAYMASAMFRVICNAPSGLYYNFADCGDRRERRFDDVLAWFASKTGNKAFFEKERMLQSPEELGKLSRLGGAALVWISQYREKANVDAPSVWYGRGQNPIAVFTGENGYYFGGKGGRATTSHGNMDAGSFIFELDGVRWVIDPGNQGYHTLEQTGCLKFKNSIQCLYL